MSLQQRLEQRRPVVLDGAISTELERRGVPMSESAWSGAAADTHPDIVRTLHADYIRAGAEVITTNTYATVSQRLEETAGLGDRCVELLRLAGRLARIWVTGREV